MEHRNRYVAEVNITELIVELAHKLWIILLVGIAVAGISWATNYFLITPIYTSSTSVYVINRQSDDKMTLADLQTGTQLTKDYMYIVKSRPVTQQVIKALDLDMTHKQLTALITVNTPQDTRILEIAVKHHEPKTAKQIVDLLALISAERMVSVMNMESVNIVEEGSLPTLPSTPNVTLNTILAGLIGIVGAGFAVILIYYFNDSIRTSDDIERYLSISTLGIIPLEEGKEKRKIKKEKKKSLDEAAVTNWEAGGY